MSSSLHPVTVNDYRSALSPGGMAIFNVNDGYLEGILRGYMLGLLSRVDYGNLTQCDTLEGPLFFFFFHCYGGTNLLRSVLAGLVPSLFPMSLFVQLCSLH